MRKNKPGFAVFSIAIFLAVVGWGMNIYKLFQLDFEAPYRAEAIRVVSLIPFIGAFTGWMTIED